MTDVTTATFNREVLEASKTTPVIVDFWAPWCGPCRALTPIIEKVAAELKGRVKLVKVNSDDNPELSQAYGIRSIPNVIAFKDGRPAAQFVGAQPEAQVRTFMEKLLPSQMEEALVNAEALLAAGNLDDAERQLAVIKPDLANAARIDSLTAQQHRTAGIACAFLSAGLCGAHDVRPSSCAAYHSLSRARCEHAFNNPADIGTPRNARPALLELQAFNAAQIEATSAARKAAGLTGEQVELHQALRALLDGDATEEGAGVTVSVRRQPKP